MPVPPPAPLFVFRGDTSDVHSLLFHEVFDKKMFAGSTDGTVHIWDLTVQKHQFQYKNFKMYY